MRRLRFSPSRLPGVVSHAEDIVDLNVVQHASEPALIIVSSVGSRRHWHVIEPLAADQLAEAAQPTAAIPAAVLTAPA